MFVLLVIPIGGGLVAGLLIRSLRPALIVTGALWLVGSALLILERFVYWDGDLNVRIWMGIVVGLLGFVLAWAGHRIRVGRNARS